MEYERNMSETQESISIPPGLPRANTDGGVTDNGGGLTGDVIQERVVWAKRAGAIRPLSRFQPKCLMHRLLAFEGQALSR